MENLEALASITRLSDHVVRVLGQNPGKFTLQGTNTYLIGEQNPYILIDTGEGKEEFITVLASALRDIAKPSNPTEPDIGDIILSHRHADHVGGLPSVLALLRRLWDERNANGSREYIPPRIHKFPLLSPSQDGALQSVLDSCPAGSYTPSPNGKCIHDLYDSQIISSTAIVGMSTSLLSGAVQVLHTPGHTPDSIALYIPSDRALYTADTVLGQGTAVFEDLASLIASLRKMLAFGAEDEGRKYTSLYPGHGPVVEDGPKLISTYISHRLEREEQIVQLLRSMPPTSASASADSEKEGSWTTWMIVSTIYAEYPQNLWLPATRSVDLHLKKLEKDGRVKQVGGEGKDGRWVLVEEECDSARVLL